MAIEHCRHGITICNSMPQGLLGWAKQELQPIFLRLATFPYFFGVETGDFPEPLGLVSDPLAMDVTAEERNTAWNWLINRTVRLIRQGLSYRHGPLRHLPMPEHLYEEQRRIFEVLFEWQNHYSDTRLKSSLSPEDLPSHLFDEMKCIIGRIWAGCCLDSGEMLYDEYNDNFEILIRLTQQLAELKERDSGPKAKFIFEMGFMPYLYFIVLKCRRLDLRLAALRFMPLIGHERENLFNTKNLYYIGMRLMEIEHGICLDPARPEFPNDVDAPLPPDQCRVRSADIMDELEVRLGEDGRESEYRKVFFWIQPEAITPGFTEWVEVGPFPDAPSTQASTPKSSAAVAIEQDFCSPVSVQTASAF
ncbi:hypothetical protein Daus18300_003689 [Diaporthe australafricana]|uniref:C6 zinc finger domain-containing protein n=1 Tax=Diaporthe australafricana TaxID=127596 RepID=A0ABR3XEW8_9PEZI